MILRKPQSSVKSTRNEMEYAVGLSFTTSRSRLTVPAVSTNQNWKRVRRSFSPSSSNSSTLDFVHQLLALDTNQFLYTACPESYPSCFSRLVGFFRFTLALGTTASSSSIPISTSSRGASIRSMSSPLGATSVIRIFVGLTSALLCHNRFPTAEKCPPYWFLWISLLCSNRN